MSLFIFVIGLMLTVLSIASACVSNTPNGAICFALGLVLMGWSIVFLKDKHEHSSDL